MDGDVELRADSLCGHLSSHRAIQVRKDSDRTSADRLPGFHEPQARCRSRARSP